MKKFYEKTTRVQTSNEKATKRTETSVDLIHTQRKKLPNLELGNFFLRV